MPLICTFREEWPEWLGGILCLDKYVAIAVCGPTPRSGGGGERRQHEEERMWPPLVVVKNRQLQSIWSAERAEWWTEYCFGRNSTVDRSIDPWTRSRYQSGQSQLIKRFSCCTTNHQPPSTTTATDNRFGANDMIMIGFIYYFYYWRVNQPAPRMIAKE